MDTEWRPSIKHHLKKLVLCHMWLWKKTSVKSSPAQKKVTIRNGTCRLHLGWLVNCALEWRVKIHSFKTMVGCLRGEERMKHTETVVLYPQCNLMAVAWLWGVQCRTEELGFSLHWKATSTRMAIWIFSGTLPFPQHIFQDDGAPCHRANVVKQWKSDQNICCLNPIENLWRDLGEAVRNVRCYNLNELQQALVNEWFRFLLEIRSMPNWIRAVIQARRGYTKYWLSVQLTPQY